MNITTLGIDLAKNVFQRNEVDRHGKTVVSQTRDAIEARGDRGQHPAVPDRHGSLRERALLGARTREVRA